MQIFQRNGLEEREIKFNYEKLSDEQLIDYFFKYGLRDCDEANDVVDELKKRDIIY